MARKPKSVSQIATKILALTILSLSSGVILTQEAHCKATDAQVVVITEKTPASKDAVEVDNKICPVSGDKVPALGEKGTMGEKLVKIEYKGKIYNLCCPMCIKDFKKNPGQYSGIADKEVSGNK